VILASIAAELKHHAAHPPIDLTAPGLDFALCKDHRRTSKPLAFAKFVRCASWAARTGYVDPDHECGGGNQVREETSLKPRDLAERLAAISVLHQMRATRGDIDARSPSGFRYREKLRDAETAFRFLRARRKKAVASRLGLALGGFEGRRDRHGPRRMRFLRDFRRRGGTLAHPVGDRGNTGRTGNLRGRPIRHQVCRSSGADFDFLVSSISHWPQVIGEIDQQLPGLVDIAQPHGPIAGPVVPRASWPGAGTTLCEEKAEGPYYWRFQRDAELVLVDMRTSGFVPIGIQFAESSKVNIRVDAFGIRGLSSLAR